MNRRLTLVQWVRQQHHGQLIKDTALPYFEHVLAVANIATAAAPLTYEIGLCHDLLEKTLLNKFQLSTQLENIGYKSDEAEYISGCVAELTRHFTKTNNPLPKKERKELEDERLVYLSPDAQSVKYADLSYNADWMLVHDRHHAPDYLRRKIRLLEEMTGGDTKLRSQVLNQFRDLLNQLSR